MRRSAERLPARSVLLLGLPTAVIGLVLVLVPGWSADVLGFGRGHGGRRAARLLGVRELVATATFTRLRTPGSLWVFVAQDAMDLPLLLGLLGRQRRTPGPSPVGRAVLLCLLLTVVDVTSALRHRRRAAGRHATGRLVTGRRAAARRATGRPGQ